MRDRIVFFTLFFTLLVTLMGQVGYLYFQEASSHTQKAKERLVGMVGLPDLALVSDAHYLRHRSLSDVFSYFNESPELLEYFPSTFLYRFTPHGSPSRIEKHAF